MDIKIKKAVKVPKDIIDGLDLYCAFDSYSSLFERAVKRFFKYNTGMQTRDIKSAYRDSVRITINPYLTKDQIDDIIKISDNFNDGFCRVLDWCLTESKQKANIKPFLTNKTEGVDYIINTTY
jgi:hypothetical protein